MFKRRNPRSFFRNVIEFFWPRTGWARAASYIGHRLRRLPDTPEKIARGIASGVFTCFTPLYGFHFFMAAFVGLIMRGNILAALLATFFGNPFTFPLIAALSLELGNLILKLPHEIPLPQVFGAFTGASWELWVNFTAIFTDAEAHWENLTRFFWQVFLPYLVGGLIPGFVAATAAYFLSCPLIAAYQKRRRKKLKKRFDKMREQAAKQADDTSASD